MAFDKLWAEKVRVKLRIDHVLNGWTAILPI